VIYFEGQKQPGSVMGRNSRTSPVWVIDVEVPKQDMISRTIGNSSRIKGNILWVSSESGSSGGWFSNEVGEKFCILYMLWISTSLTPLTEVIRRR
jgi:hypothetical protein